MILTANHSAKERARVINIASAAAFIVLVVALLARDPLFHLLSISVASFEVDSGMILMFMAAAILHALPSPVSRAEEEVDEAATQEGIAVIPLGIPVAAGPGAISAALTHGEREKNWTDEVIVIVIVGPRCDLLLAGAAAGGPAKRILGKTGINAINRVAWSHLDGGSSAVYCQRCA